MGGEFLVDPRQPLIEQVRAGFTVRVAGLEVAEPQVFVNTARYLFPVCEPAAVKEYEVDVAPLTSLHVVPPSTVRNTASEENGPFGTETTHPWSGSRKRSREALKSSKLGGVIEFQWSPPSDVVRTAWSARATARSAENARIVSIEPIPAGAVPTGEGSCRPAGPSCVPRWGRARRSSRRAAAKTSDATATEETFRLRRARINLTDDFAEQFDFKIEGDFEQSDGLNSSRTAFEGTDIFVNWHQFPWAQIKVGQWKAPFGLEQTTPDTSLYIIERSLPTGAITPERQLGIQLWGKPLASIWPEQKDLLTYYAGIFNGNGRNITNNDNNNFMYVGRLESTLFKSKMWGESYLKLGADVLNSRDDAGTNISQSLNLKVNADGSLSPFTLPTAAERTAWSLDAWLKLGRFDLIGEYLDEYVNGRTVNGVPGMPDFTTNGYYITAGYFLIPKKLQLAVQWQDLNPGQKGSDGIRSITGGLNYYIHGDDIKLMVNYIHTWSDFREAHPEFGKDDFDEVIGRVQVMF